MSEPKELTRETAGELIQKILTETRVTDRASGGEKGSKLAQLAALDPQTLLVVGAVAGMGAQKYDRFNYVRGFNWDLSLDALLRHVLLWANGEDFDPESDLPHLAHAAWQCLCLLTFQMRGRGTDTRISAIEPD